MIWLHGVRKDENVMKLLFEALVAVDKRILAGRTLYYISVIVNRLLKICPI